jgi:hypothetical protein
MPEFRSEWLPPVDISCSLEMPAARRFTAPRTRTAVMTKNAIVAVGMKTSAITTRSVLPA